LADTHSPMAVENALASSFVKPAIRMTVLLSIAPATPMTSARFDVSPSFALRRQPVRHSCPAPDAAPPADPTSHPRSPEGIRRQRNAGSERASAPGRACPSRPFRVPHTGHPSRSLVERQIGVPGRTSLPGSVGVESATWQKHVARAVAYVEVEGRLVRRTGVMLKLRTSARARHAEGAGH